MPSRAQRTTVRRRRLVAGCVLIAAVLLAWLVLAGIAGDDVDRRGARVATLTIDSKAVGDQRATSVVLPPGGERRRPLLVFLHGRGADEDALLDQKMFDGLRRLGRSAPIVAFPDGGDHSYWHDREDGAWGQYVTDEVVPEVVRKFGANRNRVAIGGISMGGFGAYDIARLNPGRFCAVGGHSPALWTSAGETAEGAFDDAADFARHNVVAAARDRGQSFTGQPIWLDAGDEDPFRAGQEAFAAALRELGAPITVRAWPGGHEDEYWDRHWSAYLRFYANALARCG